MGAKIDLSGIKFGKLTAISEQPNNKYNTQWLCKCDCGGTRITTTNTLRMGKATSCGCGKRENIIHGKSHTPLSAIWSCMKQRCANPNNKDYMFYGGRGISVCQEWNDFMTFYSWALSNGYRQGLQLDRIDNNKGYAPDNCKFTTSAQNCRNRRSTILVTINSITKCLSDWAIEKGISVASLYYRHKHGYTDDQLFYKSYRRG